MFHLLPNSICCLFSPVLSSWLRCQRQDNDTYTVIHDKNPKFACSSLNKSVFPGVQTPPAQHCLSEKSLIRLNFGNTLWEQRASQACCREPPPFPFQTPLRVRLLAQASPTEFPPNFSPWVPSGPEETSWCLEIKIAARQFLPLNCLAIARIAGAISKEAVNPFPMGERQFGRHVRRQFGRG